MASYVLLGVVPALVSPYIPALQCVYMYEHLHIHMHVYMCTHTHARTRAHTHTQRFFNWNTRRWSVNEQPTSCLYILLYSWFHLKSLFFWFHSFCPDFTPREKWNFPWITKTGRHTAFSFPIEFSAFLYNYKSYHIAIINFSIRVWFCFPPQQILDSSKSYVGSSLFLYPQ